ncbi:AAA family ATPase [Neisseria sp. Marseille-Q2251]|uniref:AAA family ATPase n=1 Tax=Neisseria sp. Marseille-Q2251 TaxID=2866585 RepID=UPI0031386A40
MDKRLFDGTVCFEHVTGVGTMQVDFQPNQRVYTLIGENGVGKTKFLECLFAVLLFTYRMANINIGFSWIDLQRLPLKIAELPNGKNEDFRRFSERSNQGFKINEDVLFSGYQHQLPFVYLAAQSRGWVKKTNFQIQSFGSFQGRASKYLGNLFSVFQSGHSSFSLKSLNMENDLEEWIIQRAQSANPYQANEDNRKIEIDTLLFLLNQFDGRIASDFLEINGDDRIFIKLDNQKRELSELSSGFTSILKIMQSIVAGYSYFTNEQQIANVRGVVLIDEIESHLHNEWQIKIVPLLKKLFPNTTFFITTHSSLVISQLEQGEAYRLARSKDGVVYGKMIDYPSNASFVDLLNEAFGVDLNKKKIERVQERDQEQAKKALLELVRQELGGLGDK